MKPRFEISKKIVLEKFSEVQKFCDNVSYSSKTNPVVTKILEKEKDCFFSIHSINELKNINDHSRVLFLAQGWDNEEIKCLAGLGIKRFVVDNKPDLDLLKNFMRNSKNKIDLFLRLKLKENTLRTEKYFVFGFNSDFINKEILDLKKLEFIKNIGIHFHRKTQNIAEWDLKREIESVLSEDVLNCLNYIIIGGGLPSVYANTNVKIFDGIFRRINDFREWLNDFNVKMIIEPGRFIAAPSGRLVSHIKSIYENNIIVNASVYNSDMDALIVPVKLLIENEKEKGESYVIKGLTPCSMDLFRYKVYLENPEVGDEIVFLNAGAYNFSSDFCDLEKIENIVVD